MYRDALRRILVPVSLMVACALPAQQTPIQASLTYHAPATGQPAPNFSPKGTQVSLTDVPDGAPMPPGAARPARQGTIEVGPDRQSWIPVLVTACPGYPGDLCQLYLDRNRNGDFADDGAPLTGTPAQNARTRAWWTSINKVELSVPYGTAGAQPYLVNFWLVREDSASVPDVLRFSAGSWREGRVTVNGIEAIVAAMDADNNAVFDKDDTWSAMAASEPDAERAVLSIAEARPTNRLMFLEGNGRETVLQWTGFSPDGAVATFVVVPRQITKAADRAPDDLVREERTRPRTEVPVTWGHGSAGYSAGLARAKAERKLVLLDFEAVWCGPCHTMDQWIWNDAEVAARINAGFVGVKVDADLEKALIKRYKITGYPTMMIVDATGREVKRVVEYQSSRQMLGFLGGAP
jgi:thiol-disulfide isomerase/thioredoxin